MRHELVIIVPTLNEADNIRPLYEELSSILAHCDWQLIFVDDDSKDSTRTQVSQLSQSDERIRLIHRIGRRGLSSACLEGIASSDSDYILVMDADLQHDSSIIPAMLQAAKTDAYELVIGSRFTEGAECTGLSKIRDRGSRTVNTILKVLTRNKMSDPLSGFFLMPRTLYDETKHRVSGVGFKILLDIILSSRRTLKIFEVPFDFRKRNSGESKLDISIISEFCGLLIEKITNGKIPYRFLMFVCVGAIGAIIHLIMITLSYKHLQAPFLVGQAIATYTAMVMNFSLNNIFTYRDMKLKGCKQLLRGLILFILVCSVGALNNLIVAKSLYAWGVHWLAAALLGCVYGSVWNYFMSNILVWFKK